MLGMAACGAVGTVCAKPADPAVYFSFFDSAVRPDRYLRTMYDLVQIRKVAAPTFQGERSLEMQFRFSEKNRKGRLHWDLSPVRFGRFRVRLWNPNPKALRIFPKVLLEDASGRAWRIPYASGKRPLPASSNAGWIVFDGDLAEADCVRGQPGGDPAAITSLSLVFEVRRDFGAFGQPLLLVLDGLECF